MNPISMSVTDIVLGLGAATLLGVVAGYALRAWTESWRSGGREGRARVDPRGSYGDGTARAGAGTGGAADRWVPGHAHGAGSAGARTLSARPEGPVVDPWRDQVPADVEDPIWGVDGPRGATVLVVDDQMELRAVHGTYLQQHGYRVITAADGDMALSLVREHHPAVVVLDHSLPGRTGIEVTRELKGDPRTARIPVILMTAHSYGAIGMAAKQAGVAAFLPKPVDPSRVLREVERHARLDAHDA